MTGDLHAPPIASFDFASECGAIAHVESVATLCCYLKSDHGGLHWDKSDGLWWTTAPPPTALDVIGGGDQ